MKRLTCFSIIIFTLSVLGKSPPEATGTYPGSTEEERLLIQAASTLSTKRKLQPARIIQGTFDTRICRQTRAHTEFLASQSHPNSLPRSLGHAGHRARANDLFNEDLPVNTFEEIVTETFPNLSGEEAAEMCIQNWYNSPKHARTLTKPSSYYCVSMKKGHNGRHYCVGIGLYQ